MANQWGKIIQSHWNQNLVGNSLRDEPATYHSNINDIHC